jgi:peptide/nickel transport system substrate-binding protein
MRQRRLVTALAIPLALVFVAASCGSDDSSSDTDTDTGSATTEATETETTDDSSEPEETTAPEEVVTTVDAPDEITYGGDVIVGLEADVPGLRPWEDILSSNSYNIMYGIFDTLLAQTADGEYEGFLAESITPNDDFTVWTMTLRPGVAFHDGTPVTAQTIADMFPLQQAGANASGQVASAKLVGVAAIDELTVEYTLSETNSAFPAVLAGGGLGMVFQPEAAAADSAKFSLEPIGTGAFTIQTRDIDNETVIVKNPNYWRTDKDGNELPYLDSVTFRPIPDEGNRLDALISGTTNAMTTLRQGTIRDALEESGLNFYQFQGSNIGGGYFNTLKAPFDDQRVRLGLVTLTDQDEMIKALGGEGISQAGTQWSSADSPWWTQEAFDSYSNFDFEKGKGLLQEYIDDPTRSDGKAAGEKIDVTLSCPPDPSLIAYVQVIEQIWSGSELVNVNLTSFDQSTHINMAINDEHDAHCWRMSGEGDPSGYLNPAVADPAASPVNFSNYFDPELVEWANEAGLTDDFETRKELFGKINQRWNEQGIFWYAGQTATLVATQDDIFGLDSWTLPDGALGLGTPNAEARWADAYITQ